MPLVLDGTNGVSGVDGTASNPAIEGTDSNTGIFYPAADTVAIGTNGTEALRVNSSQNVGIGTSSPGYKLDARLSGTSSGAVIQVGNTGSGGFGGLGVSDGGAYPVQMWGSALSFLTGSSIYGSATEKMRIDSSGNVGIGETSPAAPLHIKSATNNIMRLQSSDNVTGNIYFSFYNSSGTQKGYIGYGASADDSLQFYNVANSFMNFATNDTERARITSGGEFYIGTTTGSFNSAGTVLFGNGQSNFVANGVPVQFINRLSSDGTLISFSQASTEEGTISVAGNTVSYNPFLGSHAGAFADWSRPEVKIGTIFETINELIDYKVVVIEVPEEVPATEETEATTVNVPKRISYNGNGAVGTTATVEYEGQEYTGIIENERGQLRDFNKHVKVKINDTPDSKAVYGVFVGWNTDPSNDGGVYNDMLIGAVGNYVIRMASGQTPEIGDLVKADGTGCAIVQEDDIVRTKTVGKITNTIPQLTYEDGSFLVACVLYCG